jgi:hypothetical protein
LNHESRQSRAVNAFRPDRGATGNGAGARWKLSRAGIINVYQYGDETLHFGDGRLLLRGVNGSGKSTAMNMLLPFLLDGDTRRIDAAGEQSGVLRSWMLSGRDEPQPQGYLWIEFALNETYTSFGCGIRANRSTDRVTTWWFITSRRPGIDLHLVEGRVPLTADQLRAVLEPGAVFGHDQRAVYRDELRRRLFGGGELEQHLRLLHIVRNPRVGDRLDEELPRYLEDALPQLSEAALEDAAQPLEDLEEHRKNVAALSQTETALAAIHDAYRSYARTELHRISEDMLEAVGRHDGRRREETRAEAAQGAALEKLDAATRAKQDREGEIGRLREALRAFEASEAYQSGAQLGDLRRHVNGLARSVADARSDAERWASLTRRALENVKAAERETGDEQNVLRERLVRLSELSSACGLAARPPGAPAIAIAADEPAAPQLPSAPLDASLGQRQLDELRGAARQRRGDVREVEEAVREVDAAERMLRASEERLHQADAAHVEARAELDAAASALQERIAQWRDASLEWLQRLAEHCAAHGLGDVAAPAELDDPTSRVALGQSLTAPLRPLVEAALERHRGELAELVAALARHDELVAELEARVAELAAKQLPDPPAQPWQLRSGRTCLTEWVDFADDLDAASRAGLEAAMEAAGLLAAEVHEDGALRLADGQLLVSHGSRVPAPLSRLLRASPPEGESAASANAVERVLRSISTDPFDAEAPGVVTVEGEFRLGVLRGRHRKSEAEHVGVGARRAALERQRAEAIRAVELARNERDQIAASTRAREAAVAQALELRDAIPGDRDVVTAFVQREQAERQLERAAELQKERRATLEAAERNHARTAERAHQMAARLSLPRTLDELRFVANDLEAIGGGCSEAQRELARLAQAIERWCARGDEWRSASMEWRRGGRLVSERSREHEEGRARLEALESAIGVDYARVVAAIEASQQQLALAQQHLAEQEAAQLDARAEVEGARERKRNATLEREAARDECLRRLPLLRRALEVPGLIDSALHSPDPHPSDGPGAESSKRGVVRDAVSPAPPTVPSTSPLGEDASRPARVQPTFPTVDDDPDGARRLAKSVRSLIPSPGDATTTAESVRQSLRRRRDALGAGWDAEDHQPDPELPLRIDVNGPIAAQLPLASASLRVSDQLRQMSGLLSAKQHQALRNLLQGLVAREVADKLHAAGDLIDAMNERLSAITTTHGIGVELRWRQRDDLEQDLEPMVALMARAPDLRTADEDAALSVALGQRIEDARRSEPDLPYRELIGRVLDYRSWHRMHVLLKRPGQTPARLGRRTALSEGEKKIVSYLPLFAAVAASCDGLAARALEAPRFVLLDDAFAKVSEDNHAKLFGLLVELDLDFIATSERLWGTHDTVPELAITEVIRDADLGTIVLEHSHWDGHRQVLS